MDVVVSIHYWMCRTLADCHNSVVGIWSIARNHLHHIFINDPDEEG